jgi:hypothetical protein
MMVMCGHEEEQESNATQNLSDNIEEEELEVSLNTFSNSVNPHIFCTSAKVENKVLEVLIDTGSNNNFIREAWVDKLGLSWVEAKRFKVYMGNQQYLLCNKKCTDVRLELQDHVFIVDLYLLPTLRFDIVLGMQWLRNLGPCIHDHNALTMEFQWEGRDVKLAGNTEMVTTKQETVTHSMSQIDERDVSCINMMLFVPIEDFSDLEDKGSATDKFYPLSEASIVNRPLLHPIAILVGRICKQQGRTHKQVLVQWSHSQPEDATWEDLSSFVELYGIPDLEDKVNFEEGSSDSFSHEEVLLDTGHIQQLVKEWAETEVNEKGTTNKLVPRRRNKPAWTCDFIMTMLK